MVRPSSTATLAPSRAASSATVRPASPAPTTQISASRSKVSRAGSRREPACAASGALEKVSLMAFSYEGGGRLSPCPGAAPVINSQPDTNRDCIMRRLMLLRHAKTEHDGPTGKDQDRRLDQRGKKDAAAIGSWIARPAP